MRKQQIFWKGYTLEELRYQLMITRLCRDVELDNARDVSRKLLMRSPKSIGGVVSAMRAVKLLQIINSVMTLIKVTRKFTSVFSSKNK